MKTKRCLKVVFALIIALSIFQIAFSAELTPQDKEQLKSFFRRIDAFVSQGNVPGLLKIFSPNMSQERRDFLTLKMDEEVAAGHVEFHFYPDLGDEDVVEVEPGVIYEISGKFKAEGPNWDVSGFTATFTIERIGGNFYVNDTDIFELSILKKMIFIGGGAFLGFIGIIVLIIVLIVKRRRKKRAQSGTGPITV